MATRHAGSGGQYVNLYTARGLLGSPQRFHISAVYPDAATAERHKDVTPDAGFSFVATLPFNGYFEPEPEVVAASAGSGRDWRRRLADKAEQHDRRVRRS